MTWIKDNIDNKEHVCIEKAGAEETPEEATGAEETPKEATGDEKTPEEAASPLDAEEVDVDEESDNKERDEENTEIDKENDTDDTDDSSNDYGAEKDKEAVKSPLGPQRRILNVADQEEVGCKTVSGEECIFPFSHKGQSFSQCTTVRLSTWGHSCMSAAQTKTLFDVGQSMR